uniref:Uncharacterized protein n=1 Tax=Anguilla anguilla TaxID=7936 RepID=A0A0E9QWE7_ANGAN
MQPIRCWRIRRLDVESRLIGLGPAVNTLLRGGRWYWIF